MVKNRITIAIPAYNNENVIGEAIQSALNQEYPLSEIVVIDDCSTDRTFEVAKSFSNVSVLKNQFNIGIGQNLLTLMNQAQTPYIVYLCADDVFANNMVVSDIVATFNQNPRVGVLGRYYYFFFHGETGAIGTCREKNLFIQSCCPSGMAFRRGVFIPPLEATNKIFIEMPYIVKQYLKQYDWSMLEYDTIGARFHPGGNTGTKESYYTESPTQNWIDLLQDTTFKDFPMFVQLKNRAPKYLWREICVHLKNDVRCLLHVRFWLYAITAVIVPSSVLRKFTIWWRNHVGRSNVKIIRRDEWLREFLSQGAAGS